MPMTRNVPASSRAIACLLALIIALCVLPASALASATPKPTSTWKDTYDASTPLALKNADLQGLSCLLMDRATGRVLYEKNGDTKRFPASTTKIMTLLLALEYGHLNEMVTIPQEALDVPWDSSKTPVTPGEQMTFADLLYGMMMRSGNDAANAVAVIVGGSVQGFVDMMNRRAQELGCTSTHFMNPHGYHDANHYSTARDLALMTKEGMRHDTFRAIVSAKSYTMAATSLRQKLQLETRNSMFVSSSKFYYAPMVGVKTGFHSKAGQCYVGAATKNGVNLISVTLMTTNDGRWMDSKRLMEYGFPQYQAYTFDQLYGQNPIMVSIENAEDSDEGHGMLALSAVPGSFDGYKAYMLPDEYEQNVKLFKEPMAVEYQSDLKAPIRAGDIIGTLKMPGPDGEELKTTLVASRDVFEQTAALSMEELFPWMEALSFSPVKVFLALAALILLLIIFLRVRVVTLRNRRRKEMYRRRMRAYEKYKSMNR